jgi:hypothetical protein
MRERKPRHFKLGSDQVGMLMRGGPRSIIETGSDQLGSNEEGRLSARRRLQQIHARLATAAFARRRLLHLSKASAEIVGSDRTTLAW